ncbi:MAG: restriction endonuclease subunit S [Oscillospiraceae bacterium]|nr:restriction endonuclease subunit S [Oscillospiraceae bacterium]
MREMKDSGIEWIGEIPKEWKVLRNKNIFTCTKECVGEKSSETQLLSLTTKGVRKKDINNAEGKLPESFDTYQYVKTNDIIMCLFDLDCSAVFSGISFYDGMISPAYRVLTCTDRTFPKYAGYWFNYISYDRKFNHYAKNIRYTLSYEEFSTLPIIVPPYEEQQKISTYLDTKCTKIDSIIEKQEKVIEKLKEYKLSVITEAVTKGLNPDVKMKDSGVEWIGEIPEHWESVKIKYCTYIRARLGWKGLKADEYVETGFPLLSAFNIVNDKIVFENLNFINQERYDESPEIKLSEGDIILVKDGAGIGKCAIINYLPYPSTTNGSLAVITTDRKLYPNFLYYYFLTSIFQKFIDRLKDGMGVPHLFQSDLKEIKIVIPCYSEQQQIADYLDKKCSAIDKSIEQKQAIIEKLKEYKKSLIYEVVTGKREV